jgi:hypothetical protein
MNRPSKVKHFIVHMMFTHGQVQSKEEDEAIAKLQFAAHQKLTALEQDAAQQATLAKMRDEVGVGGVMGVLL